MLNLCSESNLILNSAEILLSLIDKHKESEIVISISRNGLLKSCLVFWTLECRNIVKKCGCIFAPERQWDVKNVCTLKFDQINGNVQKRNSTNVSRKSINGMRKIENIYLRFKYK